MKREILILTLILISINLSSQNLPISDKTQKVTYQEIIETASETKSDLYSKSLEWFALTFKSSNDVIQLKDQDKGKIIGKGNLKIKYYSRDPRISFTIIIDLKDKKCRITLTDLIYNDIQGTQFPLESFPKGWAGKKKLHKTVDFEFNLLLNDYKSYITKLISNDDEW